MPQTKRQTAAPVQQQMVTLYPTKATALNVAHPTHGKLKSAGSSWPKDGFTYRMLVQRIATEHQHLAFKEGVAPVPSDAETMHDL